MKFIIIDVCTNCIESSCESMFAVMNSKMQRKVKRQAVYPRSIERSYWIVVLKTEDWNKDYAVSVLIERSLTRQVLISKPCYNSRYKQIVRYGSFMFFKSVPKSYFGKLFSVENDMIPIIDVYEWTGKKQDVYHRLIRELGEPDFQYEASEVKRWNYQLYRRTKKY